MTHGSITILDSDMEEVFEAIEVHQIDISETAKEVSEIKQRLQWFYDHYGMMTKLAVENKKKMHAMNRFAVESKKDLFQEVRDRVDQAVKDVLKDELPNFLRRISIAFGDKIGKIHKKTEEALFISKESQIFLANERARSDKRYVSRAHYEKDKKPVGCTYGINMAED